MSGLNSLSIPQSVKRIGMRVVGRCSSLESIVIDDKNAYYQSINNCIIEKQTKTLIAGCNNSVIPSDGSVTSIASYAFMGCDGLQNLIIPDSITEIKTDAFVSCNGIVSVTFGKGLTQLNDNILRSCRSIESITINGNLQSIGSFYDCTNITSVYYSGTKKQWTEMQKSSIWNKTDIVIYCSDGTV